MNSEILVFLLVASHNLTATRRRNFPAECCQAISDEIRRLLFIA